MIFLASCLIQFPLSMVKISVLLLYKRIFSTSRTFGKAVWVAIATVVIWGLVFFFVSHTRLQKHNSFRKSNIVKFASVANQYNSWC